MLKSCKNSDISFTFELPEFLMCCNAECDIAIQVLGGGVEFPEINYKDVQFSIISVMRVWVCIKFPEKTFQ